MPLKLNPGVDTEETGALLQAGYMQASLMRWRDGLPEKIGGWTRYFPTAVSGIPRDLHAWESLSAVKLLSSGSTNQLAVIANGITLQDVTPQTLTTNPGVDCTTTIASNVVTISDPSTKNLTTFDYVLIPTPIAVDGIILTGLYQINSIATSTSYTIVATTNAVAGVTSGGAVPSFATTSGSSLVVVTLAAHGLSIGQYVDLPMSTSVGGCTISGRYIVKDTTTDTFTIQAQATATSSTSASMNAGNAQFIYYITVGPQVIITSGAGYLMAGPLGAFAIGQIATGTSSTFVPQVGPTITPVNWTIDNFGENMIACPLNGGVYYWAPNGGLLTAQLVSPGAPIYNTGVFMSKQTRILIAYGASQPDGLGVYQDPLLVRWTDIEDYTAWLATASNFAGSYRLSTGSRIVGGISMSHVELLLTDLDCWAMTFLGGSGSTASVPLSFGFGTIGTSCGLIAQHAVASFGSLTYWMGQNNFFASNGASVQSIPCSVWDAVFQDMDTANAAKIWGTSHTPFNEVIWFYPSLSGNTGECDKYVKYNVVTGLWDYGPVSGDTVLARSAGVDQSIVGNPVWATPQGLLYAHESGRDADGSPISWSLLTGWFALAEAQQFAFVDDIIPDFVYGPFNGSTNATVKITLYGRTYPSDTPRAYGPYSTMTATPHITTRFRNKFMQIKISGSDLGSFVRLGNLRLRIAPDGRR